MKLTYKFEKFKSLTIQKAQSFIHEMISCLSYILGSILITY